MSTTAQDGGFSSRLEYKNFGKKKKKGSNSQGNDYWGWFKKYGSAIFLKQYGEEFRDKEPDHSKLITSLWNEARAEPGGWEAWGRKNGVKRGTVEGIRRGGNDQPRHPSLRPFETNERGYSREEPMKIKPSRRIHFMRHTSNEVDIRMRKMYDNFTAKLRIMMKDGASSRGKFADDILRDIRFFVLIVNEYTSNVKGDRVCPAEVTLLTFSLSRGMQKVLSQVVKYHHSYVTDRDDLNEQEYNRLLESYDKTGIAVERFINGAVNPEGVDVVSTERLKGHLLQQLQTDSSNKNVPILFLKENYNEAAGMLFTLFPGIWEHLENRFCFLEDMFRIYSRVQNGDCNVHPIRDYRHLPSAPCCSYHETVNRKSRGAPKECTLKKAVTELQCLFKDLHDAKVLDMERLYDERRHQKCSEDMWDQDGPQIEWGERTQQMRENDPLVSSDEDSDGSLDDIVPVTRADSPHGSGSYGGQQPPRGGFDSRRPTSQTSSTDRYEAYGNQEKNNGYGNRGEDYGREATKENWRGGGGGSGYHNSSNYGRGGGNGHSAHSSENGGRNGYDSGGGYSKADPPKYSGLPPGFDDRDVRPAQRRRAASPTHSDWGKGEGGKREEEDRWSHNQRNGDDDRYRGDGGRRGSREDSRPSNERPRGGGVFGNRPVAEPQRTEAQFGRGGVFSSGGSRIPYRDSGASGDSVPISSRFRGNDEEVFNAQKERNEQRQQRDARNYEERESRNWERRDERERQTTGGRLLTPPREGKGKGEKKMLEDRLNPEFGGSSSNSGNSGFFQRGRQPDARPLPVPKEQRDPSPPKEETAEEAEERLEDEKIAKTVKFLPRGSFDDAVRMIGKMTPRITPIFRPYLFSASVESGGVPMHPLEEEKCDDEVRAMIMNR